MGPSTLTFTDAEFETQVLKSSTPTLVDFWAEWCGPCRALAPVIDQVAVSHAGKVNVGKLNIDEHPNTPSKYGVRSIPTLIVFKNGEPVEQIVGLVNKAKLDELLSKHL